jgi:hypothetical protein
MCKHVHGSERVKCPFSLTIKQALIFTTSRLKFERINLFAGLNRLLLLIDICAMVLTLQSNRCVTLFTLQSDSHTQVLLTFYCNNLTKLYSDTEVYN